jgi:hypothetical protein
MKNNLGRPLRCIDQFLNHFQPLFSKTQMHGLRQLVQAMFFDYKRLSLSAASKKADCDYQRLQYFFSESAWDIDALNAVRIKIIQNQKTTRATIQGVMAIDDTAVPKPYAQKTEGAAFQYCGCLGYKENANVAVASCFVSPSKHFPVSFKSYIPIQGTPPENFKSKLDLARELIEDAVEKKIAFSAVVFDSWYASSDLIESIAAKGLYLVAEVKLNRSLHFTHPQTKLRNNMRADLVIPLIRKFLPDKLKPVSIPQSDGSDKSVLTYSIRSRLKDCSTPLQIFFIFDKWSSCDDKDIHVLITNNMSLSAKEAIATYLLRWGIEESFRELKDDFCFDQYQVHHQEQIQRHWIISFLAWSLAYWIKQNACLSKILHHPPQTIAQCKESVALLIIIDSAMLLSKNPDAAQFNCIKSQRFKDRLEN